MATFTVNNQRIYARKEGPRKAQVALLIHGWSSSWFAMRPLMSLLNDRFHCLAVDLPGYGNSAPLQQRTTINQYVDILAEIIQEVTDSPVILVGHSMGGMISMMLAMDYPQLVERMVLVCPTVSGHLSMFINLFISPITMLERSRVAGRLAGVLEPYTVRATDRLMRPASFAQRTAISVEDYNRLRADARRPGGGRVRAECYTAMRASDLRGELHRIERPALVLWGAEDNTVPLRDAGVVADEWPGADLRIIPKAGHWPHFETPEITNRYIARYLGLPLIDRMPDDSTSPADVIEHMAAFLVRSDIGTGLSEAQRLRLASQLRSITFGPDALISAANEECTDLYVVQTGSIEIYTDASSDGNIDKQSLGAVLPGQITGEMALIGGGRRSAELRSGDEQTTILVLRRDRLLALMNDEPEIGNGVIWNIAATLALRLRVVNMQQRMMREMMARAEQD